MNKFHTMAESVAKQAADKRRSARMPESWTHRKSEFALHALREAHRLEKLHYALAGLAKAHDEGTVPFSLLFCKTKQNIEDVLAGKHGEAREQLLAISDLPDCESEYKAFELENKVRGMVGQIPGFFPTPKEVVEIMIGYTPIYNWEGCKFVDPSAGAGHITDVVSEAYPGIQIDVIEWNYTLQELLKQKGYNLVGSDVFQCNGNQYDVAFMNPPFENGIDMEHVMHVYNNLLKPGGSLCAVMSAGVFFRQGKKEQKFREWLDEVGGYRVDLEPGAFKESGTGVNACLVVI